MTAERDQLVERRPDVALTEGAPMPPELTSKGDELPPKLAEYLAMVAHDLRGPAATIATSAAFLEESWDSFDDDQRMDLIRRMRRNADDLVLEIGDFFQRSALEAGAFPVNRRRFSLGELIRSVIHESAMRGGVHRVNISIPRLLPSAYGDPMRHWQIFRNLLTNAARYTKGGVIDVDVTAEGDVLHVQVRDRGVGIPQEHLDSIFLPFTRVDRGDDGDQAGTGLGLHICKTLVTQQGGRIWAESVEGQGATFHYTVPIANAWQPEED